MTSLIVGDSSTCVEEEKSQEQGKKEASIRKCLDSRTVNLWELRELALTKGGLVNGMFCGSIDSRMLF